MLLWPGRKGADDDERPARLLMGSFGQPPHLSPADDVPSLGTLGVRLREAREAVAEQRGGPIGSEAVARSRRMMLRALEDYIGALETLHLPVPYALRDELRLHQQLFDR